LWHQWLMLYSGLVRLSMRLAPDEIPALRRLRGWLYGLAMPSCGRAVEVSSDAILWGLEHMSFGEGVYVGPRVTIICLDKLTIGDGVLLGPGAVISNGNHVFRDGGYVRENTWAPIHIGAGCWIGANVTILGGVRIGRGVLIAANAAVTKDIEDFAVAGGVPARMLRYATVGDVLPPVAG
jgi:acetyltransferase-like isoleucine patch superfamily enzyme